MNKFIILCFFIVISLSCSISAKNGSMPSVPQLESHDSSMVISRHSLFSVRSSLDLMNQAGATANCVLNKPAFQEEVKSLVAFTYSSATGPEVLQSLLVGSCKASTYVTPWYSIFKCKVHGTTTSKDPSSFYVNIRSCVWPKELPRLVNTFFHECLHLLNYGHGDNSSVGKQDSVNYKVGSIAEKHVKECQ